MKHLAYWTEQSSANGSLEFIKELALLHAQMGGHQGDRIADLIRNSDYSGLCSFEFDYESCSVSEAVNCRQALAFFKKCTYLPVKVDRQQVAKEKFEKAEKACLLTNELFELRDQGLFNFEPWVEAAILRAKTKISRVLGALPKLGELDFKFGPGATTLTKKSHASVTEKLQAGFSCSEDLLPYASSILEQMPEWFALHQTVEYDKVVVTNEGTEITTYGRAPVLITPGRVNFVPKDANTDRTVIVEGSLNVIVQGAIGRYMFRRLKAFGIDLSDQSRNQRLAKLGSLTGDLGTLDLVSASDMMAIALVRELLPWEWYFFLSTMRSSVVTLGGHSYVQSKFSSMGNGYTFPLQSLIFWALSSSITSDGNASVYGDDIIVRADSMLRVMRLLEIVGFEPNRRKSFWTGSFRESCGADYLSGINIRPWYHREVITPMDLFRLHNFYWRKGERELCDLVRSHINPSLLIYGPDGYGDGHLLSDDWCGKPHKKSKTHGYGGVLFDTFKLTGKRDKRPGRPGDRVLPVYSVYVRENAETVLPEDEPPFLSGERYASFLRIRRHFQSRIAVEALPEGRTAGGEWVKHPSLPGAQGYRRVSIYTFDPSNR